MIRSNRTNHIVTDDWSTPTELPDLRRVDLISIDSETKDDRLHADMGSGWSFRAGYICGLSVAFRTDGEVCGLYFPLRHPDTQNFDPEQFYRWMRDHVAADVRFVTQNGLYDWGWLRAEANIKMPPGERLEEIGALATMVDENRFKYSLDALCAWRGLPSKDDTLLRQGIEALGLRGNKRKKLVPQSYIWQLPARYVGRYAEADAVNTLLLYENLDRVLDQEDTRAAYRLECDILPMVLEMRLRGIRIDLDAAEQARNLLLSKRKAALTEISDKLGCPISMHEIQGRKWLAETFDHLNIKYPRTEKGNPSFTAGKTEWMAGHGHWLPPLIATANKYNKAAADFLQKLIDHAVNGRVHAEINPHRSEDNGTKSFRFSYNDPPLQQMPSRDEELAPLIRGVFLPEEGEIWLKPDCSQQEFRLVAHYAHQHKVRGAADAVARYHNDPDADFHAFAAALTGLDRTSAKAVNFAKIYGAGVKKFALMIGKPLQEAQRIYAQYDRELPFLRQLSGIYTRRARSQGYITLYDGARRHFDRFAPGGKWEKGAGPCPLEEAQERLKNANHPWYRRGPLYRADTHTALNALIQGSAARHTKLWMRACWRENIVPLLQMHDCLDCSINSREQAELIARLGCEAVQLDVPMRVDLRYGRNWGDAKHTWAELQQGVGKPKANANVDIVNIRKPVPKKPSEQTEAPLQVNGHATAPPITASALVIPKPEEPETLDQRLARIQLADLIGEQPVNGKIACPFHEDDTPSLHVYRDHYHCFGCGAHGGHLDWLRDVEGLGADAAIDVIFHWQGQASSVRHDNDARTLKLALALWQAAKPIADTLAVRYLAEVRGIDVGMLPANAPLRFHPRCTFGPGKRLPCLIALYQDLESDAPAGIHRIALTPEVLAGGEVERRSLGRWPRSRVVKLWPAATVLYLGEGIETVLAAATRLPYRDGALMQPAWAAVSTSGISKFPVLPDVQELRLLLDHDAAGEACAMPCRERWEAAGRKVTRLRPPQPGCDFNDVVLEKLRVAS
jgi:DNA polymerase I-like protein with 3'-5' exonuclease and polymerase domains